MILWLFKKVNDALIEKFHRLLTSNALHQLVQGELVGCHPVSIKDAVNAVGIEHLKCYYVSYTLTHP
jgi:hypothetical protein